MKWPLLCAAIVATMLPCGALAADPASTGAEFWRWNSGAPAKDHAFAVDGRGSESAIALDLGTDGVAEIVVGSGVGAPPTIRTLRAEGSQILSFPAFDDTARSGVRVAAGDLDSDGKRDIVAATGAGPSGRVRVFDVTGVPASDGFLPYGEAFHGGIAVTVGDFNGDGTQEIATIPSSAGGPHVKIMKKSGRVLGEFSAFPEDAIGVYDIVAGDFDGDGKDELAVLRIEPDAATVRIMSAITGEVIKEFPVVKADVSAALSAGDADGDGKDELFVVTGGRPHLLAYDGAGKLLAESDVLVADRHGAARIAVGSFGVDGRRLVIVPIESGADVRPDSPKFIEVDVSEQRLRAYEYGRKVRSTLVATGLVSRPTPLGDFSVLEKPYKVNYTWTYGPGNPDNYDFGWVTWNLRFAPHVYLHYAPWRKVFGVRGSHGCVNLSKADAQWIYDWADVGTPVSIKE